MPTGIARLKRRSEFLRVARTRRKWVAPGLILQVRSRRPGETADEEARIGFTASRKVGNAVARNRARRRLRAVARRVLRGAAKPGHDYVVIARQATLTRPFADLVADLELAVRRLDAHLNNAAPRRPENPPT
jgi:ribonuclease P protein component